MSKSCSNKNPSYLRILVRIRENNDYKYLVIGNLESLPDYMGGKEQELHDSFILSIK